MSSTTFVSGTTIASSWLNDVNTLLYTGVFPNNVVSTGSFKWGSYTISSPPGGSTLFLRADGTWGTPAGSGGGSGTVTQINSGTGLTGGPITTTGTLSLNTSGVTAGSYTSANITVDTYGRVTLATNGSGSAATLQTVTNGTGNNITTNSCYFGPAAGVAIGTQLGTFGGNNIYGIATTADYIGIQNNLNGSTNTLLLSGTTFIPTTTNSISLGTSTYKWSALSVQGTFTWGSYVIPAPAGSTSTFLRNDGQWIAPPGGGSTPTLQDVVAAGGSSTNSATFSTVTIGSSTGVISSTTVYGIGTASANIGFANSAAAIVLQGSNLTPIASTSVNLGTASYPWGSLYVTGNATINTLQLGVGTSGPTGTAYGIGSSTSVVGMSNSTAQVYLYGSTFIPHATNVTTLGSSSYTWSQLYLTGIFNWNGYPVPAPTGSTSTFLRNDGTWATPSGGGSGVTSITAGTGLSGGTITSTGTIALASSGVSSGSYTNTSFTVDAYGRLTSASSGTSPVTSVSASGALASSGGTTPSITMSASGVASGSYTNTSLTVDSYGRLTSASSGSAPTLQTVVAAGGSSTNSGTFASVTVGSSTSPGIGTVYGIGTSGSGIGFGNSSANIYLYTSSSVTSLIPQAAGAAGVTAVNLGTNTYPFQSLTVCNSGTATGLTASPTSIYVQSASASGVGSYVTGAGNSFISCVNSIGSANHMYLYTGTPSSPTAAGVISSPTSNTVNYSSVSDRRLKKNIESYSNSGDIIDSLLPRSFTWLNDNLNDIGFIADEVQSVFPNAVSGEANAVKENGDPLYQTLDMSTPAMMANIIAELKSLRARLKAANL